MPWGSRVQLTLSVESYGKKLLSCYPNTSILSCFRLQCQTRKNSLIGLGELHCGSSDYQLMFSRTKKKDIYVISTPMRPVPLEHFLWAGRDLHKIVDSKSKFLGSG